MAYIAAKPVRFDRRYSVGERIPDAVVDPARAPHLQAMGRIHPLPEAETPPEAPKKRKADPK